MSKTITLTLPDEIFTDAKGETYEFTGEFRTPKEGEYYLSNFAGGLSCSSMK